MNGLELAKRARESLPDLPVVLMTAFGDKTIADPAVTSFLGKPFEPEEIGAVIRAALNSSPTRDTDENDKVGPSASPELSRALKLSSGR
ncbi:MAG: hypothetical protein ACE5GX_06130 [Thermoanaerobaculia bacterium]